MHTSTRIATAATRIATAAIAASFAVGVVGAVPAAGATAISRAPVVRLQAAGDVGGVE